MMHRLGMFCDYGLLFTLDEIVTHRLFHLIFNDHVNNFSSSQDVSQRYEEKNGIHKKKAPPRTRLK